MLGINESSCHVNDSERSWSKIVFKSLCSHTTASTSEHRASHVVINFEIMKACEEMNVSKSEIGRCYIWKHNWQMAAVQHSCIYNAININTSLQLPCLLMYRHDVMFRWHLQCTTQKFTMLSNSLRSFSLIHRLLIYQQINSQFQFSV
jgi:hypothetical protein